MHVHTVCRALSILCNMTYTSPNAGADLQVNARQLAQENSWWDGRIGCFGPLRFFMQIPGQETDRILLHLRDPRDVLTSMFYSYCYSHPGEIAPMNGYRREIAQLGIDEFVIRMATSAQPPINGDYGTGGHVWDLCGNVVNRYRRYIHELLGKANVQLITYEQMVLDSATWLAKVASAFAPQRENQLIPQLRELCCVTKPVEQDDVWAHKRHVAPGNYKSQLQTVTIAKLNELFADTMEKLGYPA